MKHWTPIALLTVACATTGGQTAPFGPDEVVERTVLDGPEGVRVEVAQSREAALLRITGVGNELEGMVLPATLTGNLSRRYYETQIDGRTNRTLHRVEQQWTLYAHTGGGIPLTPDPEASAALNAKDLLRTHRRQAEALQALATFDAEGAKTTGLEDLEEEMAQAFEECGIEAEVAIDWTQITQEQLMRYSIGSYCSSPSSALRRACKVPELKARLAEIDRFECGFGDGLALQLNGNTLRYVVEFDTANQSQWARERLDELPLEGQRTIGRARIEAGTQVCKAPEQDLYVVLGPRESEQMGGVSYGTVETLYRQPERPFLPSGWFFEPRFPNPRNNANFRGYDLRVFSHVDVDDDGKCKLTCGTREIDLASVGGEAKRNFLSQAVFEPIPDPRAPYGLARDRRGVYYYVDHGATRETAKDFRLYVGRPGRMKRQRMKDIVSDSEGEIFSSPRGALKLFLGKEKAEWTSRGRTRKLLRVPISDNYPLIYGELGIYLGKKLHTPCDDL